MFYSFSMKLSQYAKQQGISYRTASRWFRTGTIKGYQVLQVEARLHQECQRQRRVRHGEAS
jgi:predicted site-specific integrase-resolvase